MTTVAVILTALAGLVHVGFFLAESVFWGRPGVYKAFGARDAEEARLLSPAFYNIGFYNLFLGLGAIAGAWLLADSGAITLIVFTSLFMIGAGLVLISRSRELWRGALVQAGLPAVALIALALG